MDTKRSAPTPNPPYYAVIFTSQLKKDDPVYKKTNDRMFELVEDQEGYLGSESFRNEAGFGVNISYWKSLKHIKMWKQIKEHIIAQAGGRVLWYSHYKIRIAKVESDYELDP